MLLLQADVPHAEHRLVALSLLEAVTRYSRALAAPPGDAALPRALAMYLGAGGMGHACPGVQSRAHYLFCRLSKQLRTQLRRYLADVLSALQPHLARIAATPAAAAPTAATSAPGGAAGGVLASDDRLYAFEAAGLLLGQEELLSGGASAQQAAWAAGIFDPLIANIERSVAALDTGSHGAAALVGGPAPPAAVMQQSIDALTRTAKGFSLSLCSKVCARAVAICRSGQRPGRTKRGGRLSVCGTGSRAGRARR